MNVQRYNYAAQFEGLLDDIVVHVRDMLVDGRYVLSAEVADFEQRLAGYTGARFCRGVNSGTDALLIALRALGVGPGSEVITQANTFHATVGAIVMAGARPVLVDADPRSFLIDESRLEEAVTERTRVILPVHLYGKPTPMSGLVALAERRGLRIVEDVAQAIGARIDGRQVGTFGAVGCLSFHPSKNLAAAGDGGALLFDDPDLDRRICPLRALGQIEQHDHVVVGLNSKLDAIQAYILARKLPLLDAWNARRREIARRYRERLSHLPLGFQSWSDDEEHVYHLFQIRTPRRDALLAHLSARGVDAVVRYPVPIHLQPAFHDLGYRAGRFPVAEALARELLCLPIRPDLDDDDFAYVCDAVEGFFRAA